MPMKSKSQRTVAKKAEKPATAEVRLKRNIFLGKKIWAGSVVEVNLEYAKDLVNKGRAEFV